jgi:tRNA(Ile)-lysidine synthase
MLRFEGELPQKLYVACSGGVDSMAVLSFLMNRQTKPLVAYFNHGTEHSISAERFVRKFCEDNGLQLVIGNIQRDRMARESAEEFWRNERYGFLHTLDLPVITAHNLDDCVETWVFSSLNGEGKIIPYRNKNVIRPFRQTPKSEFISWCTRHRIPWAEDASNACVSYARNRIRHRILPEVKLINPGLDKVIRKKILAEATARETPPFTTPFAQAIPGAYQMGE